MINWFNKLVQQIDYFNQLISFCLNLFVVSYIYIAKTNREFSGDDSSFCVAISKQKS